nr:MAG TPA: hypothetical protein [Caudoviricetes sp.]
MRFIRHKGNPLGTPLHSNVEARHSHLAACQPKGRSFLLSLLTYAHLHTRIHNARVSNRGRKDGKGYILYSHKKAHAREVYYTHYTQNAF